MGFLVSLAVVQAQEPQSTFHPSAFILPPSAYLPLPDDCHDVTPWGPPSACCMRGYVYCGGEPLAGAVVTVTNGLTTTAPLVTQDWHDGRPPYYVVDLSLEFAAVPGMVITVTASYNGHSHAVAHTVLAGSQQVDVALPTHGPVIVNSRDIETIPIPGDPCTTYWDVRSDWGGLDGHCLVTLNAHTDAQSNNSGIWRPDLPARATYRVEAWIPSHYPYTFPCSSYRPDDDTSNACYEVHYRQDTHTQHVDTRPLWSVWANLGDYEFDLGTAGYVRLTDLTGEPFATRYVVFDDMRFTPLPSPPVATFTAIQPRRVERGPAVIHFYGTGSDSDEGSDGITAYEWTSSLDGLLSAQRNFTLTASSLTTGTHTITLRVQDNEGEWSPAVARTLVVRPASQADWLFMLYLCGDNNLGYWLQQGLYKAESALSSNPRVQVVALLDGDGNGDTVLYEVQAGGSERITGPAWLSDELNLGDPQTLSDFVLWARQTYTTTSHTFLSISDHGGGIRGTAWDDTNNDYLTLGELGQAFATMTTGISDSLPIDVVHYDSCLMSMIEIAYPLRDHADYLVASENLGWCIFAYDRYIAAVGDDTTPRTLAGQVAQEYYHALPGYPRTVAALDLAYVNHVVTATDRLAGLLHMAVVSAPATITPTIAAVRHDVQKLDSRYYLVINDDDEFVDLRDLARLFKERAADPAIQSAAQGVLDAIGLAGEGFLVWEGHESGFYSGRFLGLDRAHGLSIYFPPDRGSYGYGDYVSGGLPFAADTRWDEFLNAYLPLPHGSPEDPGVPPMLRPCRVYLPVVVRGW